MCDFSLNVNNIHWHAARLVPTTFTHRYIIILTDTLKLKARGSPRQRHFLCKMTIQTPKMKNGSECQNA